MRRSWLSALLLVTVLVDPSEGAQRNDPCLSFTAPLPTTPTSPVATGVAQGRFLELWRFPCDTAPVPPFDSPESDMGVLLRITPISAPLPRCLSLLFTVSSDPAFKFPIVSCAEKPTTILVEWRYRGFLHFVFPGRTEGVSLQLDGVTVVVSLPAVPDALPLPRVRRVSDGCRPCGVGQAVTVRAVATNPGPDPILAEVRTSVTFPNGDVVVLAGPGSLVELQPSGDTVIPLLEAHRPPWHIAGVVLLRGRASRPRNGLTDRRSLSVQDQPDRVGETERRRPRARWHSPGAWPTNPSPAHRREEKDEQIQSTADPRRPGRVARGGSAEIQRLRASGFVTKMATLATRRR
jgi:hypothetical protein